MKRYEAVLLCNAKSERELRESPTGDWYHRDDLIAAGVLVPVPDGEAVRVGEEPIPATVLCQCGCKQLLWIDNNEGSDEGKHWSHDLSGSRKEFGQTYDDTIVQPVRLVKLEDVG